MPSVSGLGSKSLDFTPVSTLLARMRSTSLYSFGIFLFIWPYLADCNVEMMDNVFPRGKNRPGREKTLYIGGMFPMTGSWAGGKGCRPAVEMALEDVNKRMDILPGYTLKMVANDSRCMPGLGMNVMYELLYNEPTKLMLLGPGCSVVSTFVGQAARMWNLIVLSYGSSSPALSNRKRFPTFFRTHPSATLHNPTRVKLFQKFQWTRIATIQETQEVFTSTIEDLEERVKHAGIEIAVRTSFLTDPTNAVRNLKRQDARIIVGVFYEDMARRVFCEVYKQKLYGPKHVWFIIGWYPDNWYAQTDPSINCTEEQMKEALEGHFATEGLMLNQDNVPTISGITSQDFMQNIEKSIGGSNPLSVTGYVEAPLAYDAVWALALALNKTQTKLKQTNRSLESFSYSNHEIMHEIYSAMNSTNFLGVSGRVAFNSEGDRIAWTQIEQMWDGNYTKLGFFDLGSDNLTWFNVERWPGMKKPQDRTIVVPKLRMVSQGLFIAIGLLAAIGIIASVLLLIFNCRHQHRRYIKLSQPHINNLMLIGCIICLACIYLEGLDGRYVSEDSYAALCQIRAWVLSLGFTLAYGSMFSKVWTIYRLTTRRKKEIRPLREWEMYVVLCLFIVVDFIVLTVWQVIDPPYRELENFPHERPDDADQDIEIKPQLEHCSSKHLNVWLGVVFGYKGVLLLFGLLLAYETRSVKIKQVNDSKFVGMSIYNVVVLCIITAPVTLIIGSHQDATFAFVAVAILLSSFLAMGLIFVPKILEVSRNPLDGVESTSLTDSTASREEEERHHRLTNENDDLKKQIAEKEDKIRELNRRLQLKNQQRAKLAAALDEKCGQLTSGDQSLNNQVPNSIQHSTSIEPNVGTLVNIATSPATTPITNTGPTAPTVTALSTSVSNLNDALEGVRKSRAEGDTAAEQDQIAVDASSDSALPTSSTAKSSKTSASEEVYSESYC